MLAKSRSYRDLVVWQKSMELVTNVYDATKRFPKEELFGLTSQMRRAAVSIVSNIAEGSKRGSSKDFRRFLIIARGSGAELETQIELARRLEFFSENASSSLMNKADEIMRMLYSLCVSLDQAIKIEK